MRDQVEQVCFRGDYDYDDDECRNPQQSWRQRRQRPMSMNRWWCWRSSSSFMKVAIVSFFLFHNTAFLRQFPSSCSLVSAAVATTTTTSTSMEEPDFVVAGYLPDYRVPDVTTVPTSHSSDASSPSWLNATSVYLTDLYLFSTDFDPSHLWQLQQQKQGKTLTKDTTTMLLDEVIDSMFHMNDKGNDNNNGNGNVCCLDYQRHWVPVQQANAYRLEQTGQPLRLWLTVGGVERSQGFAQLLQLQQEQRQQNSNNDDNDDDDDDDEDIFALFGKLLVRLCQRFQLTGIILDDQHEQGLNRLAANGKPRDMTKLVRLTQIIQCLETIRSEFDSSSLSMNNNNNNNDDDDDDDSSSHPDSYYQLAITMRPGIWLPSKLYQIVDRIHVMAYDTHAPNIHNLERAVKPMVQLAIQQVRSALKQQQPKQKKKKNGTVTTDGAQKLLLGFPGYARHGTPPYQQIQTFAELYNDIFKTNSDSDGKEEEEGDWKTFLQQIPTEWKGYVLDSSPTLVQEKVQWAKSQNLTGVFLWELGQDKVNTKWGHGAGLLVQAAATAAAVTPSTTATTTTISPKDPPSNAARWTDEL